jgi:GDPmannose 4,6-dehydratase
MKRALITGIGGQDGSLLAELLLDRCYAVCGIAPRGHARVDPELMRGKAELHDLVRDASRARSELGWRPEVSFQELVQQLVEADLERTRVDAPVGS